MRNLPLAESGRAIANASGIATVELRSAKAGEWWKITNATVNGNSALEPVAKVYRGFVSDSNVIGGSLTGNFDSASGDDFIQPGVAVICQWIGATAGSQFTFTIQGERGVG
jgi:hypothetical protein